MKPFAKRLLAAVSAAAIILTTIPAVHADNAAPAEEQFAAVDVWAREELIPAMVRSVPAAAPLTRQGLSTLVMNSYKSITGLTNEDLGEPVRVFTDCDDTDVLNACRLELIPGVTAGIFAPTGNVTRQDFWTIAANLLEAVGYPYISDIHMDLRSYADADQVTGTAEQSLKALLYLGIVTAEKGSSLSPANAITAEEAVAILDAVEGFYTEWAEDPVEPQCCLGEDIAAYALNYVGCRYVRGGQGPSKFDCSGFVYYVYKHFGYSLKPGARNQWSILDERISKSELQPGDLVFFSRGGQSSRIFHVGIYIGDGQFVHAANSRKGVIVSSLSEAWYANRYHGAKRVIG